MTIAIGFVCQDGLVLAADSEITANPLKFEGDKAWYYRFPFDAETPRLKVGIVGAGDEAYLRFAAQRIHRVLQPDMGLDGVQQAIQNEVNDIHLNHLFANPTPDRPAVELLVGIVASEGRRLITSSLTAVTEVKSYQACGIGLYLANFLIRRFHSGSIDVRQAVALSSHILMHTRQNVHGCGGRSNIIALRSLDTAAGYITDETIKKEETYAAAIDAAIQSVMFCGVDRNTSDADFMSRVETMKGDLMTARNIRKNVIMHIGHGVKVEPLVPPDELTSGVVAPFGTLTLEKKSRG